MGAQQIVFSIITLTIAVVSFVIAYRQSKEKGFVFNNSYIYASKEERKSQNWTPEYKQSKVAFVILGIMFSTLTLEIIVSWGWLFYAVIGIAAILVVYAIVSSIKGVKKKVL